MKASFDNEGVYINGALSGARTGTSKFTAYVSPYLVVSNGGNYTKHVYMGSQRITSKVSNSGIFTTSPVNTTELQAKYEQQTTKIKERFDSLGVAYSGLEQTGGLVSSTPPAGDIGGCYFYHPDHLGSSSLITDGNGHLVQHIQYVPFGEVFLEQRSSNSKWSTPYKFNGKELDEETGLAYYHARYYDPRTSVWLSVDPLAEDMPGFTSYHYCSNNPVMRIDPDGRSDGNVQIPYAQKADYTNNAVVNAATFVNNSCASVVNGAVSLINGALNIVQTPPAETASQLKSEVTNTVQGVKQFFTTPLSQHSEDAKQALTSVSFWEDFAGAAGTMYFGGALSKTSNVSATTTTNAAKISVGPSLKIADNKLVQHAHQWGLAEKGAALTSEQLGLMRKLTNHIYKNASTIRQGSWGNPASGGFKDALFYSNGKHIVVTQTNGSMITILRNATGNKHFNNATTIWTR